jgi:hypothetical protein
MREVIRPGSIMPGWMSIRVIVNNWEGHYENRIKENRFHYDDSIDRFERYWFSANHFNGN